jgi:hypothetical protein
MGSGSGEMMPDSQHLPVASWVEVVRREYLSEFVPAGGSAVKFVSGAPDDLTDAASRLHGLAQASGFHDVRLDAALLDPSGKKPDYHRTDRFFFALTRSLDWKALAAVQALSYLRAMGIEVRPGRALSDLDGIAEDNGRSRDHLLALFSRNLVDRHLRDRAMGAEFRNALFALVQRQLVPETLTPTTEEVLVEWLRGVSLPGGAKALKRVQVYERISAANAWTMLRSFTHWLPESGKRGLLVILDFRAYENVRVPKTRSNKLLLERIDDAVARGASGDEIAALMASSHSAPPVVYQRAGLHANAQPSAPLHRLHRRVGADAAGGPVYTGLLPSRARPRTAHLLRLRRFADAGRTGSS